MMQKVVTAATSAAPQVTPTPEPMKVSITGWSDFFKTLQACIAHCHAFIERCMGEMWSIDMQVKLALCQLATSTDKETNIATARKAIQVQLCSLSRRP